MHKRLLIILTTITLSTALLVGCGNKQEEIPQATTEEIAPEQTEEEATPPTEIAEPTPEATTEPVEEATTEPETTEPMETVEPESTEEPTPEPEPQAIYTYTDMSATMYAQQTVNVRDLPDTSGNKLGSLSTNDEITISGQCNETSWYRFEYNGSVAYVSNKYVGENKVEVQQQATADNGSEQANSGSSAGATHWYDGYEMYTWYDMGSYFFFLVPPTTTLQENTGYLNAASNDIKPILEERYPGKSAVSVGGWGNAWTNEIHTLVFDAIYIVDGYPQWEYGTHIWE
ncbi:MAG: SH3 domain-containing protein [Lachnospiraceae bacterium]|nr:SH3 domain-containing protein [Lachnospiraceae bacterium]